MIKNIKKNCIPYMLFFISFIILLFRAKMSFCWSDESLYMAITDRFYNGDVFFYDEWFPTQLSSLLTLPIYALYNMIIGSNAGVMLFFRILYVIFETVSAVFVYSVIAKHHEIFPATIIGLLTQWYTHLNIATLSYYTMSTHFFLMTVMLLYDIYMSGKKKAYKLIVCGVLFALCVFCLPTMCVAYFAVVFVGFFITFLAFIFRRWKFIQDFSHELDFINTFIYTLIGIVGPALIFLMYFLTHISISNFLAGLTYVLSDDEHQFSRLYPLRRMYLAINESFGSYAKIAYLFIAASFILFLIFELGKILKYTKIGAFIEQFAPIVKLIMFAADTVLFVAYFIKSFGHTGYIFTALMLFSLPLFLLTEEKNYKLFIQSFIGGLTFSLVYSYSSDCMLYVLAMGHFIAALGGIILAFDFVAEITDTKLFGSARLSAKVEMVAAFILCVIVIVSTAITCVLRVTNVYRDDKLKNLTVMTDVGPAKGLYTSAKHYEKYMDVYNTINEYCMTDPGELAALGDKSESRNLLISTLLPYGYLISDMRVAAPTAWRNSMDNPRLKEYYELHPDRTPDVILVMNIDYGSYETCGDVEADPEPNPNASEGYMYDYIKANNMQAIPVSCGTIYTR